MNPMPHDHLHAVLTDLADVLDAIPKDGATLGTPCSQWSVHELRQHVIGWLAAFTDGFCDAGGLCSDHAGVTVQGSGSAQVRDFRDRLATVLPQATERPMWIGEASLPGDMALAMILWEYQVHGWDLARAAGLPWDPDEAGVTASLAFAPGMLTEDFQGEGKAFGPAVTAPAGATVLDQLVALSGRDPNWRP